MMRVRMGDIVRLYGRDTLYRVTFVYPGGSVPFDDDMGWLHPPEDKEDVYALVEWGKRLDANSEVRVKRDEIRMIVWEEEIQWAACDCGSTKVGGIGHATWCARRSR